MELARSSSAKTTSTCAITCGGAPQLVRSYSAGSSGGGVDSRREQGQEVRPWARVVRLRRKAREHRARLYIVRRCLHMLLCWRDDTKR